MDEKTKQAKLIRLELLNLHKAFGVAVVGLLARLDAIDPPEKRPYVKPKSKEESKAFFKSI